MSQTAAMTSDNTCVKVCQIITELGFSDDSVVLTITALQLSHQLWKRLYTNRPCWLQQGITYLITRLIRPQRRDCQDCLGVADNI